MKTQFITSSTSRQVLCMLLLVGLGDILPKPTKIGCGGGYSCGGTGVSKRNT